MSPRALRVLGVILVLSLVVNAVLLVKYRQQSKEVATLRQDPNALVMQQTKELVAKVGKLIDLPTDETPTVATVNDPEKLKDQPFFAKAQVGQKVLIYTGAKKAILYDEKENKIIDVAPLTINPQAPAPTTTTDKPANQ